MLKLASDAWSSGQISSKLWLCRELEKIYSDSPKKLHIWVYGGWHGVLSFMLLTREKLPINRIRSFDIDPSCEKVADTINENWIWQDWTFKAITKDCNKIDFNDLSNYASVLPNIIICTSSEHFSDQSWWNNIPKDTTVVIQSNNYDIKDHVNTVNDVSELERLYPMNINYKGHLNFKYDDFEYTRFMIIGNKL